MNRWLAIGLWMWSYGCGQGEPLAQETAFQRDLGGELVACTQCHGPNNSKGSLDLTDLWALVDAPSTQIDMKLIEPGNHLRSYLWHKVAGTQSIAGGLGQRMPVNHPWPDEELELLGRWIDLGCPP